MVFTSITNKNSIYDPEINGDYDFNKADDYIGKYILIGITYVDQENQFLNQTQMHGKIIQANSDEIIVRLEGENKSEENFSLPPKLDAATPGIYTIKSTGEQIVDPDYISVWTHYASDADSDSE